MSGPERAFRVDRRRFLQMLGATALAREARAAAGPRVVVAGAGIVGASIAFHLAKSGATVTVIDRDGPATHASRGSFAWINATWSKQPRSYHRLNQAGVQRWKSLEPLLNLPVRWGGSLEGNADASLGAELVRRVAEQREWGESTRIIDAAELQELEPNADFTGLRQVVLSGNDGATDPVAATHAFLSAAAGSGARIVHPCELTGVEMSAGKLKRVLTNRGDIPADRLVLATGAAADAGKRFADWDVPLRDAPGATAVTTPMPRMVQRVLWMPGVHVHQRDDGRIVLGEEAGPPPDEAHALRLQARPEDFPAREIALEHAERMRAAVQRYLPGFTSAQFEGARICWRPLPLDGHPVLGTSPARPDVYLATMHSGVTLAPVVGELVAGEVAEGRLADALGDFRPDRKFARGV